MLYFSLKAYYFAKHHISSSQDCRFILENANYSVDFYAVDLTC